MHGVVRYPWKLILEATAGQSPEWQLYNLSADPQELSDLSEEHPKIRDELKTVLFAHIKKQTSGAYEDPGHARPTNRDVELLRSLG